MIRQHYKNFNEAFIELNRWILMNPQCGVVGPGRLFIDDVFITVDNHLADKIDLGQVGYKTGKWNHLLRNYVDLDKLQSFFKGLTTVPGTTYSFDFKTKEKGNGGCIKSIVVTRKNRKEWTDVHVFWRTCQFENKFAGDLIMISRILNEAPNMNVQKIYFHIPQGYQSSVYVPYFMEQLFNVKVSDLKGDCKYYQNIRSQAKWKDPGHRLCLRAATARHQKFYWSLLEGKTPKPIMYNDCKLPFTK